MKKLLFLLLLFPVLLQAQVIYNTSDNLYDDYNSYLENGNWRSAENAEKNAIRTSDLMLMMLWASAMGYSTDSISALITKLNSLSYHGETFTAPSFTYDASLGSYVTVDSIRITGGSWTAYFHTTDSINSLIEYALENLDTIKFENGAYIFNTEAGVVGIYEGTNVLHISDAVGGYSGAGLTNLGGISFGNYNSDVAAAFKNDSTTNAADSTIILSASAIRDLIEYAVSLKVSQTAIDTLTGINYVTNALALKAPQTAVDTLVGVNQVKPYAIDTVENASFTDLEADILKFHDEQDEVYDIQGDYHSSSWNSVLISTEGTEDTADIELSVDHIAFTNRNTSDGLQIYDDFMYPYLGGVAPIEFYPDTVVVNVDFKLKMSGTQDTVGIYGYQVGDGYVLDTMEWSRTAKWMLEHESELEPFEKFFNNRTDGELNWPRFWNDSYYGINPASANNQFMGAFERTWIYMNQLYKQNKQFEKRNNFLYAIIILLIALTVINLIKKK